MKCKPCSSLFICAAILAVTWMLWRHETIDGRVYMESLIQSKAERAQSRIFREAESEIKALARMAKRAETGKEFSKVEWERDAALYIKHFPFYRVIAWVDVSARSQWVVPGNSSMPELDLFSQERKKIETAGNYDAEITPVIDLGRGEKGFLVYAPILSGREYIVGVFKLREWLNDALSDGFKDFTVSVREKNQEVYRLDNGAGQGWGNDKLLDFFGNPWQISVAPTEQWIKGHRSDVPFNILIFGATMAFLFPLVVYLARTSKYHAEKAESANRELAEQLAINKLTEEFVRASETNYRHIMGLIPDMVYRLDAEGRFTYVSPGAANFGFEPEHLIGKRFDEIVHPDDRHIARYRFNEKRTGERAAQRVEFRILLLEETKNCEVVEIPIHLSASGLYQNKTVGNDGAIFFGTQGIIRDITEHKRARELLLNANNELDQRVNVRTEELAKVNRDLQDEMQTRKTAMIAVQESEQRLQYILDNAPMLVFLKDLRGRYFRVNQYYTAILDMKEKDVLGKTDHDLYPLEIANKLVEDDDTVLESRGGSSEFEETIVTPNGPRIFLAVKFLLNDSTGKPYALCGLCADITERKEAEDVLQKSHRELAQAQKMARMGNWVWDITRNELRWSDEIYRIFGFTPQEFEPTYEAFLARVHPLDRDFVKKSVNDSLYNRVPYDIEHRIVIPDGSIRIVHEQSEITYSEEGDPLRMVGTVQDITEAHRVRRELEISRQRLRELCAHLESVREEERSRIAREVHDDLGQKLTALKIDIAWVKRRIAGESDTLDKLQSMSALADMTIEAVHRITAELRRQILDILGLFQAIEWEAKEFQNRTGVKCWLNLEKDGKLDEQSSTMLFRIFQEAMTNVARHANASNVHITLKEQADNWFLEVRDDGKGITSDQVSNSRSFGLIGIRERVLSLVGEATFSGSPRKGASVTVKLPRHNGKF